MSLLSYRIRYGSFDASLTLKASCKSRKLMFYRSVTSRFCTHLSRLVSHTLSIYEQIQMSMYANREVLALLFADGVV